MDRYFFDKRVMKKAFIKYGIILGFAFVVLILVNFALPPMDDAALIAIDMIITLTIVGVSEIILRKIKARKMEKEQERKEMEKRAAKQQRKEQVVEVKTAPVKKKKRRRK